MGVSTAELKVEHNGETTNDFSFPTENGTQKSYLNQQLAQSASYEDTADSFASSACEIRFVQGLIACLSTGLDDLSENVSLRLQNARIAAVLRRRR